MSALDSLKNIVLTFEQNYRARFPESRRLFNEIAAEYNDRVRWLKAGGPVSYAYESTGDAFDQILGKEPPDGAIRRQEEREKYMNEVVAPAYRRGYQKIKDAYDWTADTASSGYRKAKRARLDRRHGFEKLQKGKRRLRLDCRHGVEWVPQSQASLQLDR